MAVSAFEGLPTGAVTAATAGFDFIASPTGGGAQVIGTQPFRGARCLQLTTGSAGAICYAERSTSAGVTSTGRVFGRLRFRVPVLPPDVTGVRVLVVADSVGAFRAEVRLVNTGKLQLRNAAGTVLATSTMTVALNTYVDLGLAVLAFSPTAGQMQMRIWDAAGVVAETWTSDTAQNTLGAGGLNRLQIGAIRSGLNLFTVVVDDVDWSTTDYPSYAGRMRPAVRRAAGAAYGARATAAAAAKSRSTSRMIGG